MVVPHQIADNSPLNVVPAHGVRSSIEEFQRSLILNVAEPWSQPHSLDCLMRHSNLCVRHQCPIPFVEVNSTREFSKSLAIVPCWIALCPVVGMPHNQAKLTLCLKLRVLARCGK